MMKLSLAIASKDAMPSAFVVFRGFEESIRKASALGYNGVELALKSSDEIAPADLRALLDEHDMEVSCISTGQVSASRNLTFVDPDESKREETKAEFRNLIDLAEEFSQIVNVGRARGKIGDRKRSDVEELFSEVARELCDYAAPKGVALALEPVNRYETDFIVAVAEGADLMRKVDRPNMKLMPDVFHMNIEDVTIGGTIEACANDVAYIHLADSNRLAPGQGHTDFNEIFAALGRINYDGWVSVEILPNPHPDTAAKQAIEYLRPFIERHNSK